MIFIRSLERKQRTLRFFFVFFGTPPSLAFDKMWNLICYEPRVVGLEFLEK